MYRRPLGPKQRKAVRELGSPKLRSWCVSGSLEAPDAASAWAHLSDVLDRMSAKDVPQWYKTRLAKSAFPDERG